MRAERTGWGVALAVACGVVLLLVPAPRDPSPLATGGSLPAGDLAPPRAADALEVDPPDWQMTGGNATNLTATWIDTPPGCGLTPLWYHWTLPTTSSSGQLNATAGPEVAFEGDGTTPGATVVTVQAAALLECPTGDLPLVENSSATVTVVAPLRLANISVAPAPLTPGQTAVLSVAVAGGLAPYTVDIDWGDGTTSTTGLADAGRLSTSHVYLASGIFVPLLTAADAGGLIARASDPATVDVSSGTAVSISAVRTVADVGVPVVWNATVDREPLFYITDPECNGLLPFPLELPNATAGTCTFSVPGRSSISVNVEPDVGPTAAYASTTVSVVSAPVVAAVPSSTAAEVGRPSDLLAVVEGGVPPLTLTCSGPDLVSPPHLELAGDGVVAVPVDPSAAGRLDFTIQVTDADDLLSPPALAVLLVDPSLNASFEDGRELNATGASLSLAGSVTSGVQPFVWSIVPSEPGPGAAAVSGTLDGPGAVGWSGTYRWEGSITVRAIVADAAGDLLEDAWVLPSIPPLAIEVTSPVNFSAGSSTFSLSLEISGGLPPFNLTAASGDRTIGTWSVDTDGPFLWRLPGAGSGTVPVAISVEDAAGVEEWGNTTVSFPALPVPAPATATVSLEWGAAAAVVLAAIVVVAALWVRRRRPAPTAAAVDVTSVLRAILTPADGAERTTIELLAEQEGVPLETARSTLDQLIAKGTVRSEIDGDGIEVLSWTHERAP